MSKVKFKPSKDLDKLLKQAALDAVDKNGLDIKCPNCGKDIHVSFSGDTCKFCGLAITYGTEPNI